MFLLFKPTDTLAHSLDETISNVYLNTGYDRNALKKDHIQLEIYISWQQISYIHEKYLGDKLDSKNFDTHIARFYKNPIPHRNYITENIEIKNNGEDCDIVNLNEKKYVKDEVLLGKGVGVIADVFCSNGEIENISFLNRMLFEDFDFQTHDVNFYSYNKFLKTDELKIDKQISYYPEPTSSPQPENLDKPEKNRKTLLYIVLILLPLLFFVYKKLTSTHK